MNHLNLILAGVQIVTGAVGIVCGWRYRTIHKCSICGRHPFELFRFEYPDGTWERRCGQHLN